MVSEDKHHEGEVATDLELASLAAVLAKMSNGALANGKKICDPAAGSGNLICSSINIFNAEPNQLIANDINPKLIELLSLRLGLSFPKVIAKPNVAQITTEDIVNLNKSDFKDVDVVLLNPPFVAGINCVNRKVPFYNKIKSLKGSEAITKVGQMNLGAVFLETVCHLVNVGTTIVCIFPKAHLTERGEEAVAFRRMLLNLFGLHTIFNYPAEGLFDSVTEETCIFVGKVLQKTKEVLVYSSGDIRGVQKEIAKIESEISQVKSNSSTKISEDDEILYDELKKEKEILYQEIVSFESAQKQLEEIKNFLLVREIKTELIGLPEAVKSVIISGYDELVEATQKRWEELVSNI